jgi:hypothetical protein
LVNITYIIRTNRNGPQKVPVDNPRIGLRSADLRIDQSRLQREVPQVHPFAASLSGTDLGRRTSDV